MKIKDSLLCQNWSRRSPIFRHAGPVHGGWKAYPIDIISHLEVLFDKKEGESPFDPNPPKGSIYLEAAPSSFGVLLVPDRRAKPPSTGVAAVGPLRLAARDRAEIIQDPDGNVLEVSADFFK